MFKNDIMIKNKNNMSGSDKCYLFWAILLMICFWGAIPLGVIVDTALFGIMGCYVVYLCWSCCCNKTTKFISGLIGIEKVY